VSVADRAAPALPEGPRAPPLWQLLRYAHDPLRLLERCHARHGDVFALRLHGYGTMVMLADPEAVRDVFRGPPDALHSGEGNEFLSVLVGRTSVLVLDESEHAEQRRILLPPLKGERMRAFFSAMQHECAACASSWRAGQSVRLLPALRRITLRVILRAVLGLGEGAELDDLERKVERMSAAGRTSRYSIALLASDTMKRLLRSPLSPLTRPLRAVDAALAAALARRRAEGGAARAENVLDDLLASHHADGRPFADHEIRDAIVTLLVAGFETTSVALTWALEQLLRDGAAVAAIRAELARVTGDGPLEAAHLPQLVYLDAAIREALRLRTVLPFVVRLTKRAFGAHGREYPPGVLLAPCNHLVHRRPDLYPDPLRFRPERFLERRYAAHEWFPFGGGPRLCLGMAFALYEMKVALATLLRGVELELVDPGRSRPVREGIVLAPHDGVEARVRERIIANG
jgi:cytochrome P450